MNPKTLLIASLTFAALLSSNFAASITDLAGTWTGTRSEFVKGQRITETQRTVFRRFQGIGIVGRSRITIPNVGIVTGSGTYFPNGDYEAIAYFKGQVVAVSTGTWTFNNNTLTAQATTNATNGTYRGVATFRLVGQNRFVFVSVLSSGGRVTGTFHRGS